MTRTRLVARRLAADRRGATLVETAFVLVPLMLILIGTVDLGYRSYVRSVIEGTLLRAARRATVGDQTPTQIDDFVRSQLTQFSQNATISISKKSYSQFAGVGKEEKYVDSNGNGKYDQGVECYYDDNGNGMWDNAANSGAQGLGGSDDIVFYSVTMTYPPLVPVQGLFGWPNVETVSSNTVLRNQPYGAQAFPECKV